ncbi:MAG: PQQ-binding-like beta-propeller repeat protein, partial [Gemmataceae bacterium]
MQVSRRQWFVAGTGAALAAAAGVWRYSRQDSAPVLPKDRFSPLRQRWLFQAPQFGGVVARPLVTSHTIYLVAYHYRGLRLTGALYAIDRATGRQRWLFDDDGGMLPSASAPVLANDTLFVGEGMHANFICKLYGMDPSTGKKRSEFITNDHIESGIAVEGGTLYFGAGNEGILAADARNGKRLWQQSLNLHFDTLPVVQGGVLFAGSVPSRKFRESRVIALELATQNLLWNVAVPLPAWGGVLVQPTTVTVSVGNGRLTISDPREPAGGLVQLDRSNGKQL